MRLFPETALSRGAVLDPARCAGCGAEAGVQERVRLASAVRRPNGPDAHAHARPAAPPGRHGPRPALPDQIGRPRTACRTCAPTAIRDQQPRSPASESSRARPRRARLPGIGLEDREPARERLVRKAGESLDVGGARHLPSQRNPTIACPRRTQKAHGNLGPRPGQDEPRDSWRASEDRANCQGCCGSVVPLAVCLPTSVARTWSSTAECWSWWRWSSRWWPRSGSRSGRRSCATSSAWSRRSSLRGAAGRRRRVGWRRGLRRLERDWTFPSFPRAERLQRHLPGERAGSGGRRPGQLDSGSISIFGNTMTGLLDDIAGDRRATRPAAEQLPEFDIHRGGHQQPDGRPGRTSNRYRVAWALRSTRTREWSTSTPAR